MDKSLVVRRRICFDFLFCFTFFLLLLLLFFYVQNQNVDLVQNLVFRYYNTDGNRRPVQYRQVRGFCFHVGPQEKTDGKLKPLQPYGQ